METLRQCSQPKTRNVQYGHAAHPGTLTSRRTHRRYHNRVVVQAAQVTESQQDVVDVPPPGVHKPEPSGRVARLRASKLGTQAIAEQQRPLSEYMSLPASQYSVLDARTIERINDSTFRCYVGQLKMFGWSAEPVLTVSVTVETGGCTIRLLSCEIKGSPLVEDINRKFTAQMTNQVRWRARTPPVDSPGLGAATDGKEIVSDTSLEVSLQIPGWCAFLPTASVERVGSGVLQNVLNVMVPRFLKQLDTDYRLWATGQPRKPVSSSLSTGSTSDA